MDAEHIPLVLPEGPEAAVRPRRAPLAAAAMVLGLVVVASLALSSKPGMRAVALSREDAGWVQDWMDHQINIWNSGSAEDYAALLTPNFVFVFDVKSGFQGKQAMIEMKKTGAVTGGRVTVRHVVQQGDVAHVCGDFAADQPVPSKWYWRLERHGGKWLAATLASAWGENTKSIMPENAPAVPQWLSDNLSLYDRLWARVPASVYTKAAWFQDAVIYDRLVGGGFLSPADLAPAIDQYATQPGMGAGQIHSEVLYLKPEGDSVMHCIGTANTRTPDVGPWYARWEKRNGAWKITAEVVTVGV